MHYAITYSLKLSSGIYFAVLPTSKKISMVKLSAMPCICYELEILLMGENILRPFCDQCCYSIILEMKVACMCVLKASRSAVQVLIIILSSNQTTATSKKTFIMLQETGAAWSKLFCSL